MPVVISPHFLQRAGSLDLLDAPGAGHTASTHAMTEVLDACKPLPAVGSGVIDPVRMRMMHKMELLKAHSLPLAEHSSDKSSQDRLSQLDAKTGGNGMDWSAAAAPVSSRLQAATPAGLPPARAPAAGEPQEPPVRTSPRRMRMRAPREEQRSSDSCRRNRSGSPDAAGCLQRGRLQEALSRKRNPAIAKRALAAVSGDSAEARACCARELAGRTAAEAELKAKRAAHLISVAQRMATEAHRASKRRRVSHAPAPKQAQAGGRLVGARVAVYWADDGTYYKGVVAAEEEGALQHKVVYEDEAEEWLSLGEERFRLLAPRAASAGCDARLIRHLESLNAEELAPQPAPRPQRAAAPAAGQPAGEDAVGWRLSLHCAADGRWHEAQVIGHRPASGKHHLLYLDGEDEWVALGDEALRWLAPARAPLHAGAPPPSGEAAVGWRLAVYWKADQKFYSGSVQAYDSAMGRHHVLYSDGDEEHLQLAGESLKWLGPPPGAKKPAPPAPRKSPRAPKAQQSPQAEREARRAPPPVTPPKQPRVTHYLSHHSSRGSCGPRNGSMESVSAMLERVEADEAALMSQVEPTGPPLALQPGSHLFVPAGTGSPLSSLEGGSSNGVSPAHPRPLLPFPGAAADEPPQGWGPDAKLLGWNLVGGGSPLRGAGAAKPADVKSEPLAGFPAGLLGGPEASAGLLTAPSPSPAPLESVLPPSFSADGGLLLPEPASAALATPLAEAAAPADLEMDVLLDIPGVEAAPTAWWQSM